MLRKARKKKARLRHEGKDGQDGINSAHLQHSQHLQHPQHSQSGAADGRPAHPAPIAISNSRLFNAGTVMYVTAQKHINEWHLLDLGAFEEALALSAKNRGYDTMIAYELVRYPEEVRQALDIPDNETLVIGMCIGHATDAPINDLRVHHMPVDQYLTIRG
jgi:nitroreductase